jgi:hypothetical protein
MPDPPHPLTFDSNTTPAKPAHVPFSSAPPPAHSGPQAFSPGPQPLPPATRPTSLPEHTEHPEIPSSPKADPPAQTATINPPPPDNNPSSSGAQAGTNNPAPPKNNNNMPPNNENPTANNGPLPQISPFSVVSVAVIGTDVISAIPGTSNSGSAQPLAVFLPGGSTLLAGSITTIPANDGSGKSVVVSVGPGSGPGNEYGNLVISTISSSPNIIALGDKFSNNPAALNQQLTAALPLGGTGTVEYMGHTLTFGGPVQTITNLGAVLTYGPSGVVVQYPGGKVSTIPIASKDPAVGTGLGASTVAAAASSASDGSGRVASLINQIMNGGPPSAAGSSTLPHPVGQGIDTGLSSTGTQTGNAAASNVGTSNTNSSSVQVTGTSHRTRPDWWLCVATLLILAVLRA